MGNTPETATSILDSYASGKPCYQNAVDIFGGEWQSKFPPPYDYLTPGGNPVFGDGRFAWALGKLGGVREQNVLELGPMEGGHSYMLERAGAESVLAIEANTRAYLKCLITKEIIGLPKTRFLCGDFLSYLETESRQFDLIVASGVLYHMRDPLHLLELIGQHTSRVYLWTHYYDEEIINSKPHLKVRFQHKSEGKANGLTIPYYRHDYLDSLSVKGYSAGSAEYSTWIPREGILTALREFGFNHFEFAYEMPDHPHGPCLSLTAAK